MHNPRPYGLFVHYGELTDNDLSFIDRCAKVVTNYKKASGLDSIKYTRELPDGGFVIIQDAGGTFRAIAYKPTTEKPLKRTNTVKFDIPMLFSGVIDIGVVYKGEGVEIKLSQMTSHRLGNYEREVAASSLQRFRCPYDELYKGMFVPSMLQGMPPETVLFTQYDKLKATWFSGAMSEVVQIVSGFGRQDFENLPDDPVEQARMKIPEKVMEVIKDEIGENVWLPAYTGEPEIEGRIKYTFMFNNTNLVAYDNEQKPWLLRVGSNGVWAMPLPVIPATRTEAFRAYIEEMGDREIEKILDRFGAIPSGETFPIGVDFDRWVRAGVIVRVCDTADFYHHSPYGTACGWSSNSNGTNLVNTCYTYKNGYCYGLTYQISLQLGTADQQGWLQQKNTSALIPEQSQRVSRYLSELFEALPSEDEQFTQAIKYKIRRVPIQEILNRTGGNGASDIDHWDNYTCPPIAAHQGRCSITNQGYLYGGARLKVPEPYMQGCISMSFAPQLQVFSYPITDTIVYAYYIGDELKVIKNFRDERTAIKQVEGNFEDVMVVGKWEQKEYRGYTGLNGEFYSTDFDHRQEIAPVEITTHITGQDKGYGQPLATYAFYFWTDGILRRSRYYTHKTQVWEAGDRWTSEMFVIPFCMRNAALYGHKEGVWLSKYNERVELLSVQDPHSYGFWTYDSTFHSFDNGMKKTAKPFPVDGSPVWAEEMYIDRSDPRSDFADDGDWIGGLPANVTHLVNPPTGGVTLDRYGGAPPNVETYALSSTSGEEVKYELHVSMNKAPKKLHNRPHGDEYYDKSPDEFGNVLYEDACKVVFGDREYANISVKNEQGRRYNFGYSRLANNEHAHTFIGVINE